MFFACNLADTPWTTIVSRALTQRLKSMLTELVIFQRSSFREKACNAGGADLRGWGIEDQGETTA